MIDINEIKKYIPHRYPFLLVDRITELEIGKRVVGLKNVTVNEPFFPGHFPHNPVMPGVLIIEAMAQTAAVLAFKTEGTVPDDDSTVYFASVDNVRFKRPVVPGDQLVMEAEIVRKMRNIWKFKAVARVDGELATEAEFMCAIKR
ncbi:3-hydroxyacyl-ACP dehydratase FabZ [uncultured Zoogloea sp.]|uniref:3-hydroxyacyl-ACP dehydratase FabZ n=1 Tax=Zoogloea sp. TaxID=49181 RepID=UPI00341B86D3